MSAKGRGTTPIANDAYPTPYWAVHRLLDVLPIRDWLPGRWLEPAVGSGAILDAVGDHESCMLIDTYPNWTTVDVRAVESSDRRAVHWPSTNFLEQFGSSKLFDVAITNPPFSLAFEFAKKMTKIARHSFLLTRLNILEAGKKSGRLKWLRENTPDVYVLPDRPCFSHTLRCSDRKSDGRTYDCKGVPIAWDAPAPASIECGCRQVHRELAPGTWPVELRTAGTDASGYCWLHWDSSKLPRTSGLITHLAETPKSERVDRVVAR
jgi:hypothetical protein